MRVYAGSSCAADDASNRSVTSDLDRVDLATVFHYDHERNQAGAARKVDHLNLVAWAAEHQSLWEVDFVQVRREQTEVAVTDASQQTVKRTTPARHPTIPFAKSPADVPHCLRDVLQRKERRYRVPTNFVGTKVHTSKNKTCRRMALQASGRAAVPAEVTSVQKCTNTHLRRCCGGALGSLHES